MSELEARYAASSLGLRGTARTLLALKWHAQQLSLTWFEAESGKSGTEIVRNDECTTGGGIILKFFFHRRGFELNSGNYGTGFPGIFSGKGRLPAKLTVSDILIVMRRPG
jgi:hypothetical protein